MGPLPSLHPSWWEATLILLIAQPRGPQGPHLAQAWERGQGDMSCARGRAVCLAESIPTLPAGRGLRFLKGSVRACGAALVGINETASVEYYKVESCVSGGGVCPRQPKRLSVSHKCDVQVGVSVLLKVSMLM